MIDFIKRHAFLVLGINSILVGLLFLDSMKTLSAITVIFITYGLILLTVSFFRVEAKSSKVDSKKTIKTRIRKELEAHKSNLSPEREAIFLTMGIKATSPEKLKEYSYSNDMYTKILVALHPNTPVSVIEELALDSTEPLILDALIINSRTPQSIKDTIYLKNLVDLSDPDVKLELLKDHNTSSVILTELFNTVLDDEMKYLLLENPNTPKDIFDMLALGDEDDIRLLTIVASSKRVIDNPKLIKQLANWKSYDIMLALLSNQNITSRTLDLYSPNTLDQITFLDIIRNDEITLPVATLAWAGRKYIMFRKLMAKKIRAIKPVYSTMPDEDLVKNF